MSSPGRPAGPNLLARLAPGLSPLVRYDPADFRHDLIAGLSVAAVALPVGVAYAELAGLPPVVGLYASILPLVAYAIFGTSRQLVMGPDAATCALVAASVGPLAGGDRSLYLSLSVSLAFLAGLLSIAGRFLRLGALADFLSKPILVGFLNGVSISILLGQAGKVLGFPVKTGGIVQRLIDILGKLPTTHLPTLAVGTATFVVLAIAPRILPAFPRNLVAMVAAAAFVALLGLDAKGVAILGEVPSGLPHLALPVFPLALLPKLLADAAGLALVTFTSMMLTARSFASRRGYDVDADREFAALGAANIAAALSQSFAVSGADSRTAVSDAAGGKTQVTGLVAAATLSVVLLFFTGPLRWVPVPALGAVLILASVSLLDIRNLRIFWDLDRVDCLLSILVTFGVVAVGAINAILVAVVVAVIRFVRTVSRPPAEVLGRVPGMPGYHGRGRHPDAETVPGVVVFRFNGPLVFFNAPHFKREALAAAEAAGPGTRWFVLDTVPTPYVDATGLYVLEEVDRTLERRGVVLVGAGRMTEWREWCAKHKFTGRDASARHFPTVQSAVEACLAGRVTGASGDRLAAGSGQADSLLMH